MPDLLGGNGERHERAGACRAVVANPVSFIEDEDALRVEAHAAPHLPLDHPEVDELASIAMDVWATEQGYRRIEPGLAGV